MANFAALVRRYLIWLLLGVYAVATVLPGPGARLAKFDLGPLLGLSERATAPLLMVSLLLFLAALAVDVKDLRTLLQRPGLLLASLIAVWLGPALTVAAAGSIVPTFVNGAITDSALSGLLLGLILVAAMPVANSSVAWTQQSGGSLPWSLGLVVTSILISPWVAPLLMRWMGLSLSGQETEAVENLVRSFSGASLIIWVLLPTAAGLLLRKVLGADRLAEYSAHRQLASAAILLALNYATGSLALPEFFEHPSTAVLIVVAAAALMLALSGVALATLLAAVMSLDHPTRDALRYALSMKHTGLALALAVTMLGDQAEALLVIVIATPTQHAVAALVDRLASVRVEKAAEG